MAVAWPTETEDLNELFRFALFLGGDREEAAKVVREVIHFLETKPEGSEEDRARRYCFLEVRKRMLKSHPNRTGALLKPVGIQPISDGGLQSSEVLLAALRSFPEPVRSAAALFYATDLPVEDIGRVLDISQKELAVEMGMVRSNLLSMGVATV